VGPRACLEVFGEQRIVLHFSGFELQTVQPVTQSQFLTCSNFRCSLISTLTGLIVCCVAVICQSVTGVVGLLLVQCNGYVMFTAVHSFTVTHLPGMQILR